MIKDRQVLVTAEEMRRLDAYSIQTIGIPSLVLMERAALAAFEECKKRLPGALRVLIFAGTGNNGADGMVMARLFRMAGDDVRVVVTGNRAHATPEWSTQFGICQKLGIPVTPEIPDAESLRQDRYDLLVDAMLGTGLARPLNDKIGNICDIMAASHCFVAAVDIPTGISADTGAVLGKAVRADLTVTFEFQKRGLALYPGADYAGECVVRSIGISHKGLEAVEPKAFTLRREALCHLPARLAWANKGSCGKVLVMAGSKNMAGAAILAAKAAYRTGAGLVRVFTPECNRLILQTALPEAVLTTYEDSFSPEQMDELLSWADAVVIGPGLSTDGKAKRILRYVLQYVKTPLVADADALNILAANEEMASMLNAGMIITPHLGEMARLTGLPVSQIQADPVRSAREYAAAHEVTVVQKDARTVVVPADGNSCFINTCGNAGMATGGSGDVLSGVLGALLASGMDVAEAAVAGVLLHAAAGDAAAAECGQRAMLAGDIIEGIKDI